MKLYLRYILILLALQYKVCFAQVGMMRNSQDRSAALDLRQSNKGLLVPRFSLISTTDASSINGASPATSLLVYNTNAGITGPGAVGTGFYYWEGAQWRKLVTSETVADSTWHLTGNSGTTAVNFLGSTNASDVVIKVNNTERMRLLSNGNVGVGTNNTPYKMEVSGTTKIGGNLYLGSTPTAPQSGTAQLVRDNNTGQVFTVASSSGSFKAYNYVKYTLGNVRVSDVDDFDTKISATDYSVSIVGYSFSSDKNGMMMQSGYSGTFASQSVYAFVSGGTWHLTAKYPGGTVVNGVNGNWDVYCLVINNAMLQALPTQSLNMGGNSTGSFTAAPSGL